jgi:hypothetical protein
MTVSINILNLPANNGSAIIDIEYRVNGGTPASVGGAEIDTYPVDAELGDEIEIRAVNAIGPGPWSNVKDVTDAEENMALWGEAEATWGDDPATWGDAA